MATSAKKGGTARRRSTTSGGAGKGPGATTGRTKSSAEGQKTARKAGSSGAHHALSVRDDEDQWTAAELAEVKEELEDEVRRLSAEIEDAEQDMVELMRGFGDGAGDDQADAGAATWEREHELSITNNARGLLEQAQHALARIADGSYGDCESCGEPIGKMRLQAFPRATLCMTCKQKQERR